MPQHLCFREMALNYSHFGSKICAVKTKVGWKPIKNIVLQRQDVNARSSMRSTFKAPQVWELLSD